MSGRFAGALCLGAIAGLWAENAYAQPAFSLSLTVDRSAAPEGRPQVVEIPVGNLNGFPEGDASLWSINTPFGDGGWFLDSFESTNPADHIFPTDWSLPPAQTPYHFQESLTFNTLSEFPSWLSATLETEGAPFDVELQDNCYQFDPAGQFGVDPNITVHNCDAVDFRIGFDDLGLRITGQENSANLSFIVDPVGYTFTSSGAFNRSDALEQFSDAFLASPDADELAAHLLGQTGPLNVQPGTLPTDGSLLTGSFTISRSAAAADPGLGLPAQSAANYDVTFGFASIPEIIAYGLVNRDATLDDFGLDGFSYQDDCFDLGGGSSGRCDAVDLRLGVMGLELHVVSTENNPDVTFEIARTGVAFTSTNALDRDEAVNQFADHLSAEGRLDDLVAALLAAFSATRPDDPLVGNPQSLQGSFNRALLNLDEPSDLLGETSVQGGGRDADPPGWMVGARMGVFTAGAEEASFVEAAVERGFRVGEGRRSRVKLSAPFNYTDYGDGNQQSTAAARVSLEMPLHEGKWVIEPSAGVGYFFETDEYGSGALYAFGVSSRYKIAPVGRGHIVIGNAVSYSSTIEIEGSGPIKTPEIQNAAFRNGVAYQVPVGERVFGRQATLRASYAYTTLDGDDVFLDSYHDMSVSFGIGSREASVRQIHEAMRIGASATVGEGFEAYSLNLGFRF